MLIEPDFYDFGINGKRRPYPILGYQITILWACQLTSISKPPFSERRVTEKGSGRRGLTYKNGKRHTYMHTISPYPNL